jgi:hypothetical protein
METVRADRLTCSSARSALAAHCRSSGSGAAPRNAWGGEGDKLLLPSTIVPLLFAWLRESLKLF